MTQQVLYQALEGARTLRGGVVRVEDHGVGEPGMYVATVGDEVVYPDGSVATITSGAGIGMMFNGRPVALVGSDVSGYDRIVSSPDNGVRIGLEDGQWIVGLFDQDYAYQTKDESHG